MKGQPAVSHVLAVVTDLPAAVAEFRDAGFDVHLASDRHAHVWFAAGPVIELLTHPPHPERYRLLIDLGCGRGAAARMLGWRTVGEGFCDLALRVDPAELPGVRQALRAAGEPMGRAVRWRRRGADGTPVRFRFAYPRRAGLPFLVTPYDPPQHPVATAHANGATGVAAVVLGVAEPDRPGLAVLLGPAGVPGLQVVPAARTGVQRVEITGLSGPVSPRGVRLVPAAVPTGGLAP